MSKGRAWDLMIKRINKYLFGIYKREQSKMSFFLSCLALLSAFLSSITFWFLKTSVVFFFYHSKTWEKAPQMLSLKTINYVTHGWSWWRTIPLHNSWKKNNYKLNKFWSTMADTWIQFRENFILLKLIFDDFFASFFNYVTRNEVTQRKSILLLTERMMKNHCRVWKSLISNIKCRIIVKYASEIRL